jgi:UDP-2,3-diacylglucosamine hydrolase
LATYFISDLHLSGERPDIIKHFIDFLQHEAAQAEALYILGDLFELWIGDDALPPDMEPAVKALSRLSNSGVPIYVMRGNRDFLIGNEFAQITGCTLLDDPTIIDLYGQSTLLMHGDTLCTDDVDYQQFRQQVRDPAWQAEYLAKTVDERLAMAKQARQISEARTKEKPEDIMDVNSKAVENTFQQYQVSQIIHGHTHRPAIHELVVDSKKVKRIVLGDWYTQKSILKTDTDGYLLLE